MALYRSEFTRFMNRELEKRPEWREDQHKGRALLWDKSIDQEERRRWASSGMAAKAYSYDDNFIPTEKRHF